MVDTKDVAKIAPLIIGACNWSLLAGMIAGVEWLPASEIKNAIRGVVYVTFLGAAIVGFLGRKKRANAKIYNDRVYIHDSDSGRVPHMGYIARVNVPNVFVNPWAVFAPIMADVVRLCMVTGSLSCTPKAVKWLASSDGARWNLDPIGCNEVVSGRAAAHLRGVISKLNDSANLTTQQQDMKDGIEKMQKNGLKVSNKTSDEYSDVDAESGATSDQVTEIEKAAAEALVWQALADLKAEVDRLWAKEPCLTDSERAGSPPAAQQANPDLLAATEALVKVTEVQGEKFDALSEKFTHRQGAITRAAKKTARETVKEEVAKLSSNCSCKETKQ